MSGIHVKQEAQFSGLSLRKMGGGSRDYKCGLDTDQRELGGRINEKVKRDIT